MSLPEFASARYENYPLIQTEKGLLVVNVPRRVMRIGVQEIGEQITLPQMHILAILLDHSDGFVLRKALYLLLYPQDQHVTPGQETNAIDPQVSKLRSVLSTGNPKLHACIPTNTRKGYMFTPHESVRRFYEDKR